MKIIKSSGFWVARWILVVTGNFEIAAVMKLLPRVASLPLRLRADGDAYRLEYLAEESELRQWMSRFQKFQHLNSPELKK